MASRASSTLTGSGGSCFTPAAWGLTSTLPLTSGAKPPTTSRTAEGKTLTPRTMSMSSVRPMQRTRGPVRPQGTGARADTHVVACPEAEERRRAVLEMSQHELAGRAVVQRESRSGLGIDRARRARSRARPGAFRPAPRTPPRATGRCRRSPSPRSPSHPSLPRASHGRAARRRRARPRRGRARRSSRGGRSRAPPPTRRGARRRKASTPRPSARARLTAAISRSVFPVPTGMWQRPMRSNASNAAPATNGPAL